ncbi:class I SAM-dependent methyltransferase [Tsukamurella sp. 8F]|uniref:class I SAM-dependent methyltransferase n=1 Tax=unclassified Tsukamurella TaxID=2633480 RepID=UPI0023B9FDBA|nr:MULTISPECIES: class I SAM-dependent methyltransferase [unclassified Tsukamurella]MDF0529848.1 class I SAM-dependent methyltransferase [Tsukamurella sp. 8J]MDF0587040.1 class I SAM-dependent methyltransferase [Tsukamurella sp. 8F]
MTAVWEPAFAGDTAAALERGSGRSHPLPVRRWRASDNEDTELVSTIAGWCRGPTVDLGCGPGRVVESLLRHGVPALGVDSAPSAVALTRARGGAAILRDVFAPLPGEGRWSYALLLDGNIGIGGDPHRLIERAARLVARHGSLLVEVDTRIRGIDRHSARLHTESSVSEWFPWCQVGPDAVDGLAWAAHRRVRRTVTVGGRRCVELAP